MLPDSGMPNFNEIAGARIHTIWAQRYARVLRAFIPEPAPHLLCQRMRRSGELFFCILFGELKHNTCTLPKCEGCYAESPTERHLQPTRTTTTNTTATATATTANPKTTNTTTTTTTATIPATTKMLRWRLLLLLLLAAAACSAIEHEPGTHYSRHADVHPWHSCR